MDRWYCGSGSRRGRLGVPWVRFRLLGSGHGEQLPLRAGQARNPRRLADETGYDPCRDPLARLEGEIANLLQLQVSAAQHARRVRHEGAHLEAEVYVLDL